MARWVERAHVVNAGDGWHEHPTQALLDCFTVRQVLAERKGVGARRARRRLLRGPARAHRRRHPPQPGGPLRGAGLHRPRSPRHPGRTRQPAAALARGLAGRGGHRPRRRARRRRRGLAAPPPGRAGERLVRAQPARVHRAAGGSRPAGRSAWARTPSSPTPGPMVRGVEIASDVADLPRTVVTQQVANGVAVRMAILFLLLGGRAARAPRRCPPLPDATLVIRGGIGRRARGLGPPRRRRRAATPWSALAETIDPPPGRRRARRRAAAWSARAWSTCTPTCASPAARRPRRSRAAPGPPRSVGYTAVVAMPNTEPRDRLGRRGPRGARARAGVHRPRWPWPAPSRWAGRARPWPPWASWPRSGCTLFTDDGAGVQDGALMRRALDYAKGLGVTLAQHCEDACLAGGRRHARGLLVEPARASRACRPRPRRRWWPATSRWSA